VRGCSSIETQRGAGPSPTVALVDPLYGLKLLRIVAPRLAAAVVVVGCFAFPHQTATVLTNSAEKRAAQLVELLEASLAMSEKLGDERPAH
jgi:hypothetical protein